MSCRSKPTINHMSLSCSVTKMLEIVSKQSHSATLICWILQYRSSDMVQYLMQGLIPSCGRRLCCTRQRMQLVVMAAVLVLAGAGQGCSFGCHPMNISIPVESCGSTEFIFTTICAGLCYHEVKLKSLNLASSVFIMRHHVQIYVFILLELICMLCLAGVYK